MTSTPHAFSHNDAAADYALGKDCIMHGYLLKLGNPFLTQWQRRYFYLFPNRLEWRGEGESRVSACSAHGVGWGLPFGAAFALGAGESPASLPQPGSALRRGGCRRPEVVVEHSGCCNGFISPFSTPAALMQKSRDG